MDRHQSGTRSANRFVFSIHITNNNTYRPTNLGALTFLSDLIRITGRAPSSVFEEKFTQILFPLSTVLLFSYSHLFCFMTAVLNVQ